jgi:hypothetical protein
MRRMFGFALLFILSSIPLIAAKNSQTFYLSSDVRAGNVELPRGICEVTWSTTSGSRVRERRDLPRRTSHQEWQIRL